MAAHSYMPTIKRLYAMAQMLDLPVDFTESTTVRHSCTIFIVQVSVGNLWAESRGPNRREAKTRACGLALRLLDSHRKNRTYPNGSASVLHYSHPEFGLGKDPCTRLSELLMARKNPPAQYRLLEGTVAGDQWVFSMEVTVGQCTAVGKGGSKKEARRRACTAHLQIMGYKVPEEDMAPFAPQTTAEPAPKQENPVENPTPNEMASSQQSRCVLPAHILPDFRLEKDPITRLSELQMIRREKFPEYRMISGELVNGSWMFTMEVSVDQYTASGSGPSKKEAKRSASTALLLMMGFTVPQKDLVQEKPAQKSPEEHLDTKIPEAPKQTPDQKNQKESHSPQATAEDNQEDQPPNSSNDSSESHQILGETPEIHQGLEENPEDLETLTETHVQEDTDKQETEDSPLENPEETQPLDNPKSPEEGENPESLGTPEGIQNLEVPKSSIEAQHSEELNCPETLGLSEEEIEEKDGWKHQCPEEVEPQTAEEPSPEEVALQTAEEPSPEEVEPQTAEEPSPEEVELQTAEEPSPEEVELQTAEEPSPEEVELQTAEEPSPEEVELQNAEEPNPKEVEPQTAEEPSPEEVELQTPEDITAKDEKLQTEEPNSAPEPTAAPQASQTPSSVERLVILVLVKKMLKKLPAKMRSHHDAIVETLEKALDQFRVPDGVYLKPKNIKKLGKAGARDLIHEYGSACKLLLMALQSDPTEFQNKAMKHLNMRLTAFRNRPRTGLAQFLSKWDKPKKRAC